ncbi:MAG: Ig-like domain repeat protein, partial [Tepidisphaeraceae bacterium]
MISFARRFARRSRGGRGGARRHRAIGTALEPLEKRILLTWIGALSGNTNDAAHQYNNAANWSSGAIEDSFAGATFTGNTTLYFTANHTTGAGGLNLGYSGNYSLTFMSSSTTASTLTLDGSISAGVANQSVTIGDVTNTDDLNLSLGAAGISFNTASGEQLVIANVVSGAHTLAVAGTGAVALAGANSYSGGTTLPSGATLDINSSTAIGTGTLTINGGTIDNTSGSAITLSTNNAQTWGGNFTFNGTNALNLGTGAVTLGASLSVTANGSPLTVGGVIGDGGNGYGITEAGNGTLALSGTNTFSSGMTLSAGTLDINNAAAIGTGTFTINGGTIDNTSGGAITLSNNNAQTWGANFTFGGTNNLNLGTGAVTLGGSLQLTTGAGNLTVGGAIGDGGDDYGLTKSGSSGTLTLSGNNTFSGEMAFTSGSTGGQLNINSATATGFGEFAINSGTTLDNTSGAPITLTSNSSIHWNGSFTFAGTNNLSFGAIPVPMSSSHTATVNAGTLEIDGVISGTGYKATKAGNGGLTLAGANTYTGGTLLNAGTLNIDNASAVGTGLLTIHGGTIDNTSSGSITLNNNAQSWTADFTFAGTQPLNLGTGAVAINTARTVTVTANTLTVGGVITSTHVLTEAGSGALTLSGASASAFTGGVTLDAGSTLNINNAAALGTGRLTISGGTIDNTSGSAITLSTNNAQTWGGDFTFVGSNPLNLGTGAVTLGASRTVTVSGSTLTVGGVIGDSGNNYSITKAGAGILTLTGSNTFGGGVTINAGTLLANDAGGSATGAGAVAVNNGATLGGTGTASGAVTVNSGGALAPGNGATSIFNTGNLILDPDSNLDIVLNGNTAGSGYDQVNVTGSVTVTSSILSLSGTRSAHDGALLTIINDDASDVLTGTFQGLAQGATTIFSGVTYTISYQDGTDSDVVLTADPATTTTAVVSGANPSLFGQSVTFTATISSSATGTPTGMATFFDGSTTLGTGTLDGSGQTTLSTSVLSVGSHSITVVYGGDTNFTTSTSSALTQTVDQDGTTSAVSSSANPSVFGQSVTFTATVAATAPGAGTPTGTVTFEDGSTTLGTGTLDGSGQTTLSTSALSVGSHSIAVVYGGDTNFTTSTSSPLTQTVDQDGTSSSVSSSANPSVFGQSVTFTATATVTANVPGSGTPTGTVTFEDGSTTLGTGTLDGSGVATLSTSGLSVGSHSITVVYGGDTNFTTSTSSALTQTVDQDGTTSAVSSSANPS